MKTSFIKPLLLPVSVFIALMSNTAVYAADLAPALDPTRDCTIPGKGNKKLTVIAGPANTIVVDNSEELATEFPEQVPCPNGETGTCSKWTYRYIWKGMNPDHAYADMSVDVALKEISWTGDLYPLGEYNADTRWIRWSSNASTFDASFITSNAKVRSAAVGGKSGKFEGTCLIQGAGVPIEYNGFAQDTIVTSKVITSKDGDKICTKVNPATQCETAFNCDTDDPIASIPLEELVDIFGDDVINFSVPGQQCPTAVFDNNLPNTRYYCSGGRCYAF